MYRKRFLAVIKAVERHPAHKFHMDFWGKKKDMQTPPCKTAACAIGSFGLYNPKAQLKVIWKKDSESGIIVGIPKFQGRFSTYAVEEYLGINYSEADYLFFYKRGDTKRIVLKRLKEFYKKQIELDNNKKKQEKKDLADRRKNIADRRKNIADRRKELKSSLTEDMKNLTAEMKEYEEEYRSELKELQKHKTAGL